MRKFNARLDIITAVKLTPTTWDVTGNVVDNSGTYYATDALVGDVVFHNGINNDTMESVISRYTISSITSSVGASLSIVLKWDEEDTSNPFEPNVGSEAFIAAPLTSYSSFLSSQSNNITELLSNTSRNIDIYYALKKIQADIAEMTGGGTGGTGVITSEAIDSLVIDGTLYTVQNRPTATVSSVTLDTVIGLNVGDSVHIYSNSVTAATKLETKPLLTVQTTNIITSIDTTALVVELKDAIVYTGLEISSYLVRENDIKHPVHGEGSNNIVIGCFSHVEGRNNLVSGHKSHAEGSYNIVTGHLSHAEGANNKAIGLLAHAEGVNTLAMNGILYTIDANATTPLTTNTIALKDVNGLNVNDIMNIFINNVKITTKVTAVNSTTKVITVAATIPTLKTGTTAYSVRLVKSKIPTKVYPTSVTEHTITLPVGTSTYAFGTNIVVFYENNPFPIFVAKVVSRVGRVVTISETILETDAAKVYVVEDYDKSIWIQPTHTEGGNSISTGSFSHAEGNDTKASGECAHAEGQNTKAKGGWTHAEGLDTRAIGEYSHTEGINTEASGQCAHASGVATRAIGDFSHTEGMDTEASGQCSHSEGFKTVASDMYAHAEGEATVASGQCSHSEGFNVVASGYHSHSEGEHTTASGSNSHSEGTHTTASSYSSHSEGTGTQATADCTHAEGEYSTASGDASHAEGRNTVASGIASHSEGKNSVSAGINSHAEGQYTIASGNYGSHAEGNDTESSGKASHSEGHKTLASGFGSHAEGEYTTASGHKSHAENCNTIASGEMTHAEGNNTTASGIFSHAEGDNTSTNTKVSAHIMGQYGDATEAGSWHLANGNAAVGAVLPVKGLAVKISKTGSVSSDGAYASSGSDYAEMFEWADENTAVEDRVGKFVTVDEANPDKIRLAKASDTHIIGAVSAEPTVLGDAQDLHWKEKWLKDQWGRKLTQEVTVPAVMNTIYGQTVIQCPEYKIKQFIINPLWVSTDVYVPRNDRPEWDAIGLLGKILVSDDGTCVPGSFCKSNDSSVATPSASGYLVLKRVSTNQILILLK